MNTSSKRRCRWPGCEVVLGRRNSTGLCGRHYLGLPLEAKAELSAKAVSPVGEETEAPQTVRPGATPP